ncbi:hypothetical protein [Methylibium petroleiphilum]|uniref:Uncharacterized protein n=1 Tax=Methylibium petroleiphilum (strain ATCC BAA-1232 / LMG 22953 / PM1) TaxID=420662 RepID=A2SNG0_METPP|nr:hypothetical protein [Methylibium petroleiphilum]ABM97099.1 hypothetical protein Mpe_B0324 [Methylibium petroleiphilum PM1]
MNTITTTTARPSLGATAIEVWRAWKAEGYLAGTSVYASAVGLGELTFQNDGLYRVVDAHLITKLSKDAEDEAWDALLKGQLQIYRRRNAPLSGASTAPTQILHQATGRQIPSGLE